MKTKIPIITSYALIISIILLIHSSFIVQSLSPQKSNTVYYQPQQQLQPKQEQQFVDYQGQDDFQLNNQQQQYLNHFATAMSDFFPQQTFYFNLSKYQQQTFIFWPQAKVKQFRGLFYIAQGIQQQSQQQEKDNINTGLYLACQVDDKIQKEFSNKRLGVFQIPFTGRHIKLTFKSNLQNLTIYLSYQLKAQQQKINSKQNKQQEKKDSKQKAEEVQPVQDSDMKQILKRFQKIDMELEGQQILINNMNHFTLHQTNRIQNEFYWGRIRIIIETLLVIISESYQKDISFWYDEDSIKQNNVNKK